MGDFYKKLSTVNAVSFSSGRVCLFFFFSWAEIGGLKGVDSLHNRNQR